MTAIASLIRTKFDLHRLVAQRHASDWSALMAHSNDFIDLECRLTALTQARRTLDTPHQRAA